MLLPSLANAQIQRAFVNLGFEDPAVGYTCFFIVGGDAVPGWNSSSAPPPPNGGGVQYYCPPAVTATTTGAQTGGQIEIWANSINGVPSANMSRQHAELNAYQNSRLYQNVCLIGGERVDFTLSHRGRASASAADRAEFNIGPLGAAANDGTGSTVVEMSTTSNGTGGISTCGITTPSPSPLANGSINGASEGLVGSPTCATTNPSVSTNGWRTYTGNFTYTGTTQTRSIGFQSTFAASGNNTVGNFLDQIQVTLRPVIEFIGGTVTSRESDAVAAQPSLSVVGTVPAGGTPVSVVVETTSTATGTADYALATYRIPAGNYATPTTLPMTNLVSVVNDAVIENNETIVLRIADSPSDYNVSSTNICGNSGAATVNYVILDNDVDVRTTKVLTTPSASGTATFTVTYQNNTAAPTLSGSDLAVHNALATISDALPAGFTAYSWTCVASGSPAPACPAANGTGAINATVALPAGTGGVAGGLLTYRITGTYATGSCNAVTNTSTIAANAPVQDVGTAQAGFTTPAPGGAANNNANAQAPAACADLSVTKANGTTSVLSGAQTTYTVTASNTAPGASADNAIVSDTPGAGLTGCVVEPPICTASGGAICPTNPAALLTGGVPIPVFPAGSSVVFTVTCNVQ